MPVIAWGLLALLLTMSPARAEQGALPAVSEPHRDGTEPGLPLPEMAAVRFALERLLEEGRGWYLTTPPTQRICWGGLAACAGLGLAVLAERSLRLRRRRIIPLDFTARFLDRLHDGKLDGGKALDYCEMNPSPAARVALAAVRRWGRPSIDLERAVALAHRVEVERLRRNVGTLRRIALVAPLLGLIGTLTAAGRLLAMMPDLESGWGPAASGALSFLTVGLAIATAAIVAFDALSVRIERLSGALDRLGAETIDAIATAAPPRVSALPLSGGPSRPLEFHPGHGGVPRPLGAAQPLAADASCGDHARP
jgi:biopolymer transport protein ExbB